MSMDRPIPGIARPAIGVRGGWLRLAAILLALATGGDRRVRGDDPAGRTPAEGQAAPSPRPGPTGARVSPSIAREIDRLDEATDADAGERRPDGGEKGRSGSGPG